MAGLFGVVMAGVVVSGFAVDVSFSGLAVSFSFSDLAVSFPGLAVEVFASGVAADLSLAGVVAGVFLSGGAADVSLAGVAVDFPLSDVAADVAVDVAVSLESASASVTGPVMANMVSGGKSLRECWSVDFFSVFGAGFSSGFAAVFLSVLGTGFSSGFGAAFLSVLGTALLSVFGTVVSVDFAGGFLVASAGRERGAVAAAAMGFTSATLTKLVTRLSPNASTSFFWTTSISCWEVLIMNFVAPLLSGWSGSRSSVTAGSGRPLSSTAKRTSLVSRGCWKTASIDTPPVKSMSNSPTPRWNATPRPTTVIRTENVAAAGNQAMKSISVTPMTWSILSWVSHCLRLGDFEDPAGDEHRGPQAQHGAQQEGDGEALDLLGADHVEHGGGDDVGEVGVGDDHAHAMEGVADGHAHGGPAMEFLAHAFIEENVVVDRHAHRQGQPRQAGKREGGVDGDHHRDQHGHVQHQGDVGHHAGEPIVDEHEQGHEDRGDEHGPGAVLDRVAAEGGTDEDVADRLFFQGQRQVARLEHDHGRGHLVLAHSRDLALLADPADDVGGRVEFAVEDDAQLLLVRVVAFHGQVAAGQIAELGRPIALKPNSTMGSPLLPMPSLSRFK